MANLLQSSQTTATSAPTYYSNYLSNLANAGTAAANAAQYVGASPLQNQAFQNVGNAGVAYLPTMGAAESTLGNASTSTSPLSAASGYLNQATQSPAAAAAGYVSPWLSGAVQSLSDVGQQNILNTVAPTATAGAVGSGQFGSQRGAQVLGQNEALAEQNLNSQIANMLNTGYGQALTTAEQQNALEGQLGTTAASAAGTGQQNLTQAGTALGNLAAQSQNLSLADINALSTLGQQQQTIGQNQQLFPLTTLSSLAGLMQGQQIPTTTETQLNTSPLSAIAGMGTLATQLFTPSGTGGTGATPWSQLTGALSSGATTLANALGVGTTNADPGFVNPNSQATSDPNALSNLLTSTQDNSYQYPSNVDTNVNIGTGNIYDPTSYGEG